MKWLLITLGTLLLVLGSVWFWLLHTESGATWAWNLAQSSTNGRLSGSDVKGDIVGGVRITNLRWLDENVDVSAKLTSLTAELDFFPFGVVIATAELSEVVMTLAEKDKNETAVADIADVLKSLELPFRIAVRNARLAAITLRSPIAEPQHIDSIVIAGFWHDTIGIQRLEIQSSLLTARMNGTMRLVEGHDFTLQLDAQADSAIVHASAAGDLGGYQLRVAGRVTHPDLGSAELDLAGSGNSRSAELNSVLINGANIDATGSAELKWGDTPSARADLAVTRLLLGALVESWPDAHPLAAELHLEFKDERVTLTESEVTIRETPAVVRLNAAWDWSAAVIDGHVQWRNLQWPIDTEADVRSDAGNVRVTGQLQEWHVAGRVNVGTEEMPDGNFTIDGGGSLDGAAFAINEGRVFGGAVAGQVAYQWRDDEPWSAMLNVEKVQTNALFPQWPGSVSGHIDARGTQRPFTIDATLKRIVGRLRDEPLAADGSFSYSSESAQARNLRVTHGATRIQLNGSADTATGLEFQLSSDEIGNYVDDAVGAIEANGRLSRVADKPYLSINLVSDELKFGEQSVTDIELQAAYKEDQQVLELFATQENSNVRLKVTGAFDDWRRPTQTPWHGVIEDFTIALADDFKLQLAAPAALDYSSQGIALADFCIQGRAGSNLCLDGERTESGRLAVKATMNEVPVALLEQFANTGLVFDQKVSGGFEWNETAGGRIGGVGSLVLSPGTVRSLEQPELSVMTGNGQVDFEIQDNELLSGAIAIPMPGTGNINGRFAVLDIGNFDNSDVQGQLDLAMSDIGVLAHFSSLVDSIGGNVTAQLELSGQVSNPQLTGSLVVRDGNVRYRPLGLHISEINLQGEMTKHRAVDLSGRFRAGDGFGSIVSSADYSDVERPGLRFKIQGDALRLIDLPNIQATMTPDVEIEYRQDEIRINGSVLIPTARIIPDNLVESRVEESNDVVIVAGSRPGEAVEPAPESGLEFAGELEVTLGEQVVVDLDVAKAKLTGATTFAWQGGPMPIANGRYGLSGSIKAFGQVLEIAEGGIRFPTVSADDPNIRIRAEREIFGNAQIKKAGVLLDGPISAPLIEAYTDPSTTTERALTLLVTGSDFDHEQGVGAVDFGTYIAPRLFISYGVSIFDRDNVISARYDLSRSFGIKASSGSNDSGVDLNYRFEN